MRAMRIAVVEDDDGVGHAIEADADLVILNLGAVPNDA